LRPGGHATPPSLLPLDEPVAPSPQPVIPQPVPLLPLLLPVPLLPLLLPPLLPLLLAPPNPLLELEPPQPGAKPSPRMEKQPTNVTTWDQRAMWKPSSAAHIVTCAFTAYKGFQGSWLPPDAAETDLRAHGHGASRHSPRNVSHSADM
jgi:hypothetical protein